MLSYWESETWYKNIDYLIIGGGIVGLATSIFLKRRKPSAKIVLIERGRLPHGASTKNAGFLCFGSIGELSADLDSVGEDLMLQTLALRLEGLAELEALIGFADIEYCNCGGTEVFTSSTDFKNLQEKLPYFNTLIEQQFGKPRCFAAIESDPQLDIHHTSLLNKYEGRLNTGKMMAKLIALSHSLGILHMPSTSVASWEKHNRGFAIETSSGTFEAAQLLLCTNAFTTTLLPDLDIVPQRNQVILTTPLRKPLTDTCYHYHHGYVYFRPIGQQVMIGGGRHLFKNTEQTANLENTDAVTAWILQYIKSLLPHEPQLQIAQQWSGILGTGQSKKPEIRKIEDGIYLAARLGGMGVAIGTKVGKELALLVD